jgi:glucose-1-phosphate adenylyltransferase
MIEHGQKSCLHRDYCPLSAELHPRFLSMVTRKTYALVLAGGRGSRLKQLTDWRAKPAVPFGGKLRIIDFSLSNCINSGIRRIGVVTQYKAQSLIRHIDRGWSFLEPNLGEFVEALPAQQRVDEGWYVGTANAVLQNLDILYNADPDHVLILGGDHIYKMDYGRILAEHIARSADVTVACLEVPLAEASRFGLVSVSEDGWITQFHEKPAQPSAMPGKPGRALASMGIYAFNARFLYQQLLRDAADPASTHDFGKDIIPHLVSRHRVLAHRFADSCVNMVGDQPYWRDVGTVDAYWEANIDLTKVIPELNLYEDAWPIWSLQQQLPPAKFVFDDDWRRGYAVDSLVSGGCIISGGLIRHSLLSTKVQVGEHSSVDESVILPNVRIGRNVTLKRVVVDKGCVIPNGFTAGVDAEQDRQRFHVTESGITLITPEMLGQQIHRVQ